MDFTQDSPVYTVKMDDTGYMSAPSPVTCSMTSPITNTGAVGGTLTIGSGLGYANSTMSMPWVTTTTATPWLGNGISADPAGAGKLTLNGDGADVVVNGESLMTMLHRIEERLNILTPNTKLESEWEELRELGNKYRALEQHIKDKQATWDRLKAMPPPEID